MMARTGLRRINIAIMALGGQGGGVLVDWIVALAEAAGWTAQATSVAGVAQRTGATVYYLELVEPTPGREPVLALMPVPGQVDVLIAAELMEAARAVERGLVTADRTTLIASSHRVYAVQEKSVPGNGRADATAIMAVVRRHARQLVLADLQALASRHHSVISATLFGALAGSGALPFELDAFEAAVQGSSVGAGTSLGAMRAGFEAARAHAGSPAPGVSPGAGVGDGVGAEAWAGAGAEAEAGAVDGAEAGADAAAGIGADALEMPARPLPERAASPALQPLLARIRSDFPPAAWNWLGEGLARVVDWQDVRYGDEYLDRVASVVHAGAAGDTATRDVLAIEAARWIAVAMSYDDVVRVADLKTRRQRSLRVREELQAAASDVVGTLDYFHPRIEELTGLLPAGLARRVAGSPRLSGWLAARLAVGRRIRTHTLTGHLQLRLLAGLRRWRRGSRRHHEEQAHLDRWLDTVRRLSSSDVALASELLRCRRLIKGYSDTHARGDSRFDCLARAACVLPGRPAAAEQLRSLREAALLDPDGKALANRLHALGLELQP